MRSAPPAARSLLLAAALEAEHHAHPEDSALLLADQLAVMSANQVIEDDESPSVLRETLAPPVTPGHGHLPAPRSLGSLDAAVLGIEDELPGCNASSHGDEALALGHLFAGVDGVVDRVREERAEVDVGDVQVTGHLEPECELDSETLAVTSLVEQYCVHHGMLAVDPRG